jgi:hypothetical protein
MFYDRMKQSKEAQLKISKIIKFYKTQVKSGYQSPLNPFANKKIIHTKNKFQGIAAELIPF